MNPLPRPRFLADHAPKSPDDVLAKNNRNNGRRSRFQHRNRTPSKQEARPLPEYLGQVDLRATIKRDSATELGIARRARPGEQAGDEPDEQGGGGGAGVGGDGGRGGEDAGADYEADDEGEAVEVGEGFVFLERVVAGAVGGAGSAEWSVAYAGAGSASAAAARGGGGEREEGGVEVEGAGDGVGAAGGTGALGVFGVVVGGGEGEFAAGRGTAGGGGGGVVVGSVVMVGGGEGGEFEAVAGRVEGGRWVLMLLLDHFGMVGGGHPLPVRGMYILREGWRCGGCLSVERRRTGHSVLIRQNRESRVDFNHRQ